MPDSDRDNWETHLEATLEQHRVSNPARVVARWKRYREKAIVRSLTELRRQLATMQSATAPSTEFSPNSDLDTAQDERLRRELNSIHARIALAESRLLNAIGQAADRLERGQGKSEKALAVLRERLTASWETKGQQHSTGGLGTMVFFGIALAAVVVTLVLALSLLRTTVGS